MRGKKCLAFAAVLALALTLFGCKQETVTQAETVTAPISVPEQAERTDVENNGGYYVRVGETIYFRRYGANALSKSALFAEFTDAWNLNGGESELMAYTPATGEYKSLFTDNGTGALWYGDGGFYLRERLAGEDYTVWYASDGKSAETICAGAPLGVTEGGLLAVVRAEREEKGSAYRTVYAFYRDKTAVGTVETPDDFYASYAGLTDEGVFLVKTEFTDDTEGVEDIKLTCRLIQLTPEGRTLDLGALPEVENGGYYDVQAERFLAANGKVAVGVGFYMGTGHFLNDMVFAEATVGQENSLRPLEVAGESEGFELPRLTVGEGGTISTVATLPGELSTDYESGDLRVFENDTWRVVSAGLCPPIADGSGYHRFVQHMDYVDGTAYVTLACSHASPQDSVGWRDGYALLDMVYLAAKPDGTEKELDCVDHHAKLYGNVWFIEGSDSLLWCQIPSDDTYYYTPEYAYLLPIAKDADWAGGREAVCGSAKPLDMSRDVGAADYNGYPLPDAAPVEGVCLTLNRDGEITSLANKGYNALLAIDFDVPESELTGAAETLDTERRDFDEDLSRFWAKLRVLEDGVRVRVERTPDECSDMVECAFEEGVFVAGETLYDATLDRGAFLALRTSLPWHPELRVSVSKDGAWGSYIFGEDNYLHLETEENVHPELTLAAYPMTSTDDFSDSTINQTLTGTWLYRSPQAEYSAIVRLDEEGVVTVETDENYWQLSGNTDRLYVESWFAPDLLCLKSEDESITARIGFGGSVGDYLVEMFRVDGKEILHLTQANNGDGALSYLLPGADNLYEFTLVRDQGIGETGARKRGVTFPAEVVHYDREHRCLWLQEAKVVDEYPGGGSLWRAVPDAPCFAYPISGEDVIQKLNVCRDPEYPLQVFEITVDNDGAVQRIA